ncbi:MAG: hypothetical protein GX448_08645 [Planctomycetes bacterium]|nr:hypothetical protein [Planctomycetota bacterium]
MKWSTIRNVLSAAVLVGVCAAGASQAGELKAWGLDRDGQVANVPAGSDYIAIAAGDAHGLALKSDGTIVAWGQNDDGECEVPAGTYKAVGAGADFSLAIRTDGTIAAWGYNGQRQVSGVPEGSDFVAVDGGELFAVALKSDGSIVAWGNNRWGQVSNVPAGTGFKAVVAGDDHAVALRSDGSLVAWGYWAATDGVPTTGTFTAIAAGGSFSLALKSDGSIVWWGDDPYGYDFGVVPAGFDYTAVSAGYLHCLALARDGSIVGWGAGASVSGHPNWGQAMPPSDSGFSAIACGLYFSLGLTGKTEPAEPAEPNEPEVPAAISDDFDGDRLSESWTLSGDDLQSCRLEQANGRLELLTTSRAQGVSAYCVGAGWHVDATGDFSFKVDYHFGLVSDTDGQIFIGITPDANDLSTRYVKLGVGCDRQYSYVWYESIDLRDMQMDFNGRRSDDGTLYVSYNAARDELYLSTLGYGDPNAWAVVAGLVGRSWQGGPLTVFLGGGTDGLEIVSGDAWLDNFIVETGGVSSDPANDEIRDVYRFWSPVISRHFYTMDTAERDKLIKEYAAVWTYEGPVYKAAASAFQKGLLPVYRFWSPIGESHLYTIQESEKDTLIRDYPDYWIFEGVAFYAYPEGSQPAECLPVYRFWNVTDNSHFYTMDESERDKMIREYPDIYVYEGVAFYAYGL